MTKEDRKDALVYLIKHKGDCKTDGNNYTWGAEHCGGKCPLDNFCESILDRRDTISDEEVYNEALLRFVRRYGKEGLVEVLL